MKIGRAQKRFWSMRKKVNGENISEGLDSLSRTKYRCKSPTAAVEIACKHCRNPDLDAEKLRENNSVGSEENGVEILSNRCDVKECCRNPDLACKEIA